MDCRQATSKICQSVLGKADYQLGRTKVFLKDTHDLYLEQERDRVLTRKILILQRCIRGWYYRRKFLKMRAAAIVIQKNFRAFNGRRKYLQMRTGYMRMQVRFSKLHELCLGSNSEFNRLWYAPEFWVINSSTWEVILSDFRLHVGDSLWDGEKITIVFASALFISFQDDI